MLEMLLPPADHVTPTIALVVAIAGMVVLAGFDIWREEVEDWAIAVLFVGSLGILAYEGISPSQWLNAVLAAAMSFVVYLWFGTSGFMGGGDVKLSIVPGLVLGAVNPFLVIWWIAGAISIQRLSEVIVSRTARASAGGVQQAITLPHVPAMAMSMLLAPMLFAPLT